MNDLAAAIQCDYTQGGHIGSYRDRLYHHWYVLILVLDVSGVSTVGPVPHQLSLNLVT